MAPDLARAQQARTANQQSLDALLDLDRRDSEQRFRQMIDALPTAIYTTDAKGKVTHFNPACVELSGRTPVVGSDHWCVTWKLFHPDGRPMPHEECPMAVALKTGRVIRGAEAIADRPDGTRIWFQPYPTPLVDDQGSIIGGINMLVDITERKRADMLRECRRHALELLANGASLEEILEYLARSIESQLQVEGAAVVAIHLMEPDGFHFGHVAAPSLPAKYAQATRGMDARLELGCCSSAVISRTPTIVRDFATEKRWPAFTAEVLAMGLHGCFTTPIVSADDRVLGTFAIYYRQAHQPSPHDQELVDLVTATVALAIDRKQAERALRHNEERYRQTLALMPAAVYSCDTSGTITYFNEQAARLWGRAPRLGDAAERFCGSEQLILPDGTILPHEECPMAVALHEGRSFRDTEVNIRRPDGSIVTVMVNIDPIRDERGEVVGAINAFHDVTAIMRAEKALAAEAEALARLNDLSSRLWRVPTVRAGLDEMLAATIRLLDADFGNVQMFDTARGVLRIEAQHGFKPEFLEFFREVSTEDDSACGRALRSGERIIIEDVESDGPYAPLRAVARAAGYRAVQSTPLIGRDGAPLGMLSTHFRTAQRPDEQALRRLDLYLRQAVDFIERKRVEETLRQRQAEAEEELADTKLLQAISAAMIQNDNVEAIYQQIMDAAVAIMRSQYASMQMLYPERGEGGELRLLAHRGFSPEAAKTWEWVRAASTCTCGLALKLGKRFIASDVATCEAMAGSADQANLLRAGILAAQSTPLVSRSGQLIGMITTHWSAPHEPSERDLRLMDILARQAADLIERRKAEQSLQRSEERQRLLSEALAQLLANPDPDRVVREFFPRVASHLDVDTYFNYMVNDDGEAMYLHACAGISPQLAHDIRRLEFGQAICGTVAQTRQPIVATDIQRSDYDKASLVRSMGIQAYACNPLMVGERLIGTLSFASRTRTNFDEGELEFMRQIAQYVAVAMDRTRTLAKIRKSEERFRAFTNATSDVVYSMSADWSVMRRLEGREFIADTLEPSATWLDKYIHPQDQPRVKRAIERAIQARSTFELEHRVIRVDGSLGWTYSRAIPILDGRGEIIEWFGAASDITKRKEAEEALRRREALLAGQRAALELAVHDAPLDDTLAKLVEVAIEQLGEDVRAAFYLANDECTTLHHVVGMCDEYAKTVDNFPIGADSVACGLAVHTGQPAYTADVKAEPRWKPWLWMAEKFDYRACWSIPIHSSRGQFIGTLAVYSRQPRAATQRDIELCTLLTQTASVIVSRYRESEARKRVEQALRKSEERFRTYANAAPAILWVTEPGCSCTFLSRGWYEYTGQTEGEALGFGWLDAVHPDDREPARRIIVDANKRREPFTIDYRLRRADGEYRWTIDRGQPRFDADGEFSGYVGSVIDVHERMTAEQALRESEERFRTLVSVITDVPWSTDHTGAFVCDQPSWAAYTGQTQEQLRGFGWADALHPDDRETVRELWQRACESKSLYESRGRLWHAATRQYRHFLARATPLLNVDGTVREWVGTCTDVEDRAVAEQRMAAALEQRTKEVIQAQQRLGTSQRMAAVGTLASGLAHDMTNLLLPLDARLSTLLKNRRIDPEVHTELTIITALLDHLRELSRNLSLFSRDPEKEGIVGRTHIGQWCSSVHKLLDASVGREVVVEWDCPASLPEVAIAPHRLTQAVQNLIHNARDAVLAAKARDPRHMPRIRVEARLGAADHGQGKAVDIRVSDNGLGMSEEVRSRCLEPFFTTRNRPNEPGGAGSGLGLSLASQIAERAGGSLSIASKPGPDPAQGTTITLTVPIAGG